MRGYSIRFLLVYALGVAATASGREVVGEKEVDRLSSNKVVVSDLFSLNVINLDYGASWPTVQFKSWRRFTPWFRLELQKGQWQFHQLDADVAMSERQGVEIMLVLQLPPTWASARPDEIGCCAAQAAKGNAAEPKNMEDWRNYVKTVALRYKGRVRYYELWNEPDVRRFYSGTVEQLVALNREAYNVLKEVDPNVTVISSALSPGRDSFAYLESYLSKGGGNYSDVIGYHFYVAPRMPEAMLANIQEVRRILKKYGVTKPLWNTETGWRVVNHDRNKNDEQWAGAVLSDEASVAYVSRSYILSWAAGVERLYWYAWGHRSMGMTEYDGRIPKPIATAYNETAKWLVGARMLECAKDKENTWACDLVRDGKYRARILWNPDKKLTVDVGKWATNITGWRDLQGGTHALNGARQVEVGPVPIEVESGAR